MYYQRMFKSQLTRNKNVPEYMLRKYINKESMLKITNLHKKAKKIYNKMIVEPIPLTYKLQELPENKDHKYFHLNEPLGNTDKIPFQVNKHINIYIKLYINELD